MENFPNNSHYVKESQVAPEPTEKKVEKVISGKVIRRKKPLRKRFADVFIGGDARSVGQYVMYDVLLPAAKDAVADAFSQGIERMLFGETRRSGPSRARNRASNGYVSYNRFSSNNTPPWDDRRPQRQLTRKARAKHDFDEVILDTRAEAEQVIDQLFSLISQYEVATVADLYNLIGASPSYTDRAWGWTDLRGAGATRLTGGGYLLDLPPTEPLEK